MSSYLKTSPHFVAYLDLLAGKNLINSQEDESLNRLHSLLQVAKESSAHNSGALFPQCKVKIFSDNIIIACRLTGKSDRDLAKINSAITLISAMQIVGMEMYHYLFRGGATIGNLFVDDVMVWGNGLVRASELECSLAVYPRIIIDNPVLDLLKTDKDVTDGDFGKYAITLDTDNMYYLDYLKAYFKLSAASKYRTEFIKENYLCYSESLSSEIDKVRQKLSWQVSYLEKYIDATKEEPKTISEIEG
jgi:hypothetical protein